MTRTWKDSHAVSKAPLPVPAKALKPSASLEACTELAEVATLKKSRLGEGLMRA